MGSFRLRLLRGLPPENRLLLAPGELRPQPLLAFARRLPGEPFASRSALGQKRLAAQTVLSRGADFFFPSFIETNLHFEGGRATFTAQKIREEIQK